MTAICATTGLRWKRNFAGPTRYLAILIVPKKVKEWIRHDDAEMALRHRAFWVSLRDAPATANATSVSIKVPYAQRLTTAALRKMVDAASRLESL